MDNFIKRFFDLAVAFFSLLLLLPLIIIISILVFLSLGWPVLFIQERPGLNGAAFRMKKFRTMTLAKNVDGELLPDAQRLTRIGRFLRSTSLDELPELWNVLVGDMSLVGPRPLLMEYLPLYSEGQKLRHNVRPGITGWAQVNGRNAQRWDERLEMDVWYVENRSLWLDLKILWMTVLTVLRREGISQEGHVTMEKFKGNDNE